MPNSNELNDAISTASKFYEYFLGKPQQPTTQDIPLGMPPASNPEQGQFANIQRPFDNTYMDTLIGGGESDSMPQLPQSAGTINGQSVPQFQVDKGKIHETKLMSKLIDLARDKSRTEQLQLQMEAQRMQDEATRRQDEFSQANGNHMMGLMAAGQKPFELQRPAGASGVPTGADQVMLQLMGKDVNAPWDMAKAEMALQSQFQKNQILQDKMTQKAEIDLKKARIAEVLKNRELDLRDKWENERNKTRVTTTEMGVEGRKDVATTIQGQKDDAERDKQAIRDSDEYKKSRTNLDTTLRNIKVTMPGMGGSTSTEDFDTAYSRWHSMTGGGSRVDQTQTFSALKSFVNKKKDAWDTFARNTPAIKNDYTNFDALLPAAMKRKSQLSTEDFWKEAYPRLKKDYPDIDTRRAVMWRLANDPSDVKFIESITMND